MKPPVAFGLALGSAPASFRLLHYSVPGLPRHEGQMADLADAREKARRVAEQTRSPAAILAHYAGEGREQVGLAELLFPSP